MPRKTLKRSRKSRRRTIRRYRKTSGGGTDSQSIVIPTNALKTSYGGINSQDEIYGIAKV